MRINGYTTKRFNRTAYYFITDYGEIKSREINLCIILSLYSKSQIYVIHMKIFAYQSSTKQQMSFFS